LQQQPVNVETEAYVALAGPVVGTIGALAVYLWGRSSDSGILLAIAYAGLFLNLFNWIPISPLDGGRITAVLSPRVWLVGAPVMLAILLCRPSPMLFVIAVLSFRNLCGPGTTTPRPHKRRLLQHTVADQTRIWRDLLGADGTALYHDVRGA
jgi:Zn-dependent protease